MYGEFSGTSPDYTIFICQFKTDECFYSWNVSKLETIKNCKEAKHIILCDFD